PHARSTRSPYTTLFRSDRAIGSRSKAGRVACSVESGDRKRMSDPAASVKPDGVQPVLEAKRVTKRFGGLIAVGDLDLVVCPNQIDRKSTRLNSSHVKSS